MEAVYSDDPMKRGLYNQLMGLDEKVFREGIQKMLKYYDKLLKEVDGVKYLPKGTILYHGSLDYPFYADSRKVKNITYLGLDMDIAMWYIYELIMNQQYKLKSFKRYGFLYVFKLVEDLPITHVIDKLYINPKEQKKCKKVRSTCLHPQVSYRGPDFNHVVGSKLHGELTLNYNSYTDNLEIIRVYIVDGLSLHKDHGDIDYNIRNAILQEYREGTDYELPISNQEYREMFLGDVFYCEYGCGFSGNYQVVLDHEKKCELKGTEKKELEPEPEPESYETHKHKRKRKSNKRRGRGNTGRYQKSKRKYKSKRKKKR